MERATAHTMLKHCDMCSPGRACVERFVTCVRPGWRGRHLVTVPLASRGGGSLHAFWGGNSTGWGGWGGGVNCGRPCAQAHTDGVYFS